MSAHCDRCCVPGNLDWPGLFSFAHCLVLWQHTHALECGVFSKQTFTWWDSREVLNENRTPGKCQIDEASRFKRKRASTPHELHTWPFLTLKMLVAAAVWPPASMFLIAVSTSDNAKFSHGPEIGRNANLHQLGGVSPCRPSSLTHTIRVAPHNGEHIIYRVVQARLL